MKEQERTSVGRSKAIRQRCRECSGDSPKETTLCPVVLCDLWPYRLGCAMESQQFRERMALAKKNYPDEYEVMSKLVRETLSEQPSTSKNILIRTFFEEDSKD